MPAHFQVGIEDYNATFYIGLYPEEKLLPNTIQFYVKIGCKCDDKFQFPDWDYSILSAVIEKIIKSKNHHEKLEDLLKLMLIEYKNIFNYDSIHIIIKKLNPPTNQPLKASFIEWKENN